MDLVRRTRGPGQPVACVSRAWLPPRPCALLRPSVRSEGAWEVVMKRALAVLLMTAAVAHAGESDPAKRLGVAATVLEEIMQAPDKAIPRDLLERAHCAAIVPGVKKGA